MISSAVVQFDIASDKTQALQLLANHPQIEVGELVEQRSLPITLEADNHPELKQLHEWVSTLSGVTFVDVVFVCFDSILDQERRGSK